MTAHGVIPEFRGKYYFLSNYHTSRFTWRGIEFLSAEQAFAYAKTFYAKGEAEAQYQRRILMATTPGDAKKLGRQCPIRVDEWDAQKVQYMREIVHAKFSTSEDNLVGPLINTGAMMLVEGNDWGDDFWGRCKNSQGQMVGFNTLGVILMEERGYWRYSNFEDKEV